MKKKTIILTIFVFTIVSVFTVPAKVSAKSIAEFEKEVNKYTAELEEKKKNLAKNDEEIDDIKRQIAKAEKEIESAKEEIKTLEQEIKDSEEEIENKKEESKSIVAYYQMSNGSNFYLEYAFGAEDITDMIYRLAVVEQLTEYNEQKMKELDELIKQKHARQDELAHRQENLKQKEKDLEKTRARILADSQSIVESMPSVEAQIKAAKESVKYYKSLGCGSTEDIQACEYRIAQASGNSLPSVGDFSRPMTNGYITRGISYNKDGSYSHKGYDLSSNNKSIAIYPIAAGVVHKMYYDSCSRSWCSYGCNGNARIIVIKHNYNGKYIYSSYVHLRGYGNVKEGQFVTSNTVIGYMGTTGCSTGPHLHIEVANCHWQNGGCNYNQYVNRIIKPTSLFTIPNRWNNR